MMAIDLDVHGGEGEQSVGLLSLEDAVASCW